MKTYRKAEAIVTQYNQDLAEWEQAVKNGQKPAEKQHRPPERQSVRNRLRQLQEEGKQNSQPKQRKKSQDRDRLSRHRKSTPQGDLPCGLTYISKNKKTPCKFFRLAGCSYKYLNLLLIFLRNYKRNDIAGN